MRKAVTVILITFLLLIITGVSILFVMLLNGNIKINELFNFNFKKSYIKEIAIDESYDNVFDNINIYTTAGEIDIYKSSTDKIQLVIYNKKDKTTVTTDNNTLDISAKAKKCNFLCINPKIAKIELYIPSDYDKSIKINTGFGDVIVEEFENVNFEIKNNYGDVKINKANNVTADIDYGDIKVNSVNELVIDSNYGDIKVDTINKYFKISCDYGDVKIENANITEDSKIIDNFGDIKIKNITGIYIDAKTDLGDVDVKGSDRSSSITLTLRADYGDIEVN